MLIVSKSYFHRSMILAELETFLAERKRVRHTEIIIFDTELVFLF